MSFDRKFYSSYLQSEHWSKSRYRVSRRDKYKCFNCGEPHKEVHHINYRNLTDVDHSDLASVCQKCHGKIHVAIEHGYIPDPHENTSSLDLTKMGLTQYENMRKDLGDKNGSLLTLPFLHRLNTLPVEGKRKVWTAIGRVKPNILDLHGSYVGKKAFNRLRILIRYYSNQS